MQALQGETAVHTPEKAGTALRSFQHRMFWSIVISSRLELQVIGGVHLVPYAILASRFKSTYTTLKKYMRFLLLNGSIRLCVTKKTL